MTKSGMSQLKMSGPLENWETVSHSGLRTGSGVRQAWIQILTLPLDYVTLGKFLIHFGQPQFSHLENGNDNSYLLYEGTVKIN